MRTPVILLIFIALAVPVASAATTRNDDSCDIATMPAATLLLPYFDVDIRGNSRTTLFTIVNTTNTPQIAKVTLWTDYAYPVIDFPVYLTGYDAQAINLRDVLAGGVLAVSTNRVTPGPRSLGTNPNFSPDAAGSCSTLPTRIPSNVLAEVQQMFLGGTGRSCENNRIGGAHENAIGYATIDVVASCGFSVATDAQFWDTLLFDNVLTGDWQIVSPDPARGNFAAGNPLVHIRAIPEGGAALERPATNLPYTFYDRFTTITSRRIDRRQPLPSAFVARVIDGPNTTFKTDFLIWREGKTSGRAECSEYASSNARMRFNGMVRFDERENAVFRAGPACIIPCVPYRPELPAASRVSSGAGVMPVFPISGPNDAGGWIAFDLNNNGSPAYAAAPGRDFGQNGRPSQNWITPVMFAEGRYSVAFDAVPLANGCSPALAAGSGSTDMTAIGPGANTTP